MATRAVGRYFLHEPIASGGMASVHLGRVVGPAGFGRTVAIKRLHPHLAGDPDFVTMFLDEARLAARVQHPNVVSTLDVVAHDGEVFLVMDYVLGESWSRLLRAASEAHELLPVDVVCAVIGNLLSGLHAAHEARSEGGEALDIVHRDVSPQNLLVGVDGVARVVDFGIAKAVSRAHSTRDGELKGKLAYMAPEQIRRTTVDRRADVYAAAVVLWESLTGRRLFVADDAPAVIHAVLEGAIAAPSSIRSDLPPELDAAVLRALAHDPEARFKTALEFVEALDAIVSPAPARVVAGCVARLAAPALENRRQLVAAAEQTPSQRPHEVEVLASGIVRTADERRALAEAETGSVRAVPAEDAETASGLSKESANRALRRGSKRRALVAAGALVLLALAGALALRGLGQRAEIAPRADPPPAVATEPASSTSSTSSASALAVEAVAQPASPPASAPPDSSSAAPPRAQRRGAPRPKATSDRRDCNPAYTLDERGVKRFKPWCL